MAVEHQTLVELNYTWLDLLPKIAETLGCSYAALWKLTYDCSELRWTEGYFNLKNRSERTPNLAELFYSLYSSCRFTPGVGFAGHALATKTNSILWMSGNELERLQLPVEKQTRFLRTAGIQTVVCLPLDSLVLEIGTDKIVEESDPHGHWIRAVLLDLLNSAWPHLAAQSNVHTAPQVPQPSVAAATELNRIDSSFIPMANDEMLMAAAEAAAANELNFSPSLREFDSKVWQQGPLYQEPMMQQQEDSQVGGSYTRHIPRSVMNTVSPPQQQLSIEIPELAEVNSGGGGSWNQEVVSSPMLSMELNALQSWTATMALADGIPMTAASSSQGRQTRHQDHHLVDEMNRELHLVPFTIDQSLNSLMGEPIPAVANDGGNASILGGSSSRSSVRSPDENEISSAALLETYADCNMSELENERGSRSSTAPLPGESENGWKWDRRSSGNSSKEVSPESTPTRLPARDRSCGIHPRLVSSSSVPLKFTAVSLSPPQQQQQQRRGRLDRQHSNGGTLDMKPDADLLAATAPALVQCGNVLQLGNASGQVVEALPQEHDEAAFSHMLAERRRRNKQNENFNQLKTLVPASAKMDKASLLAHTIQYIRELQEREKELEQINQRLELQVEAEKLKSATEGQLLVSTRGGAANDGKGSPTKNRVRSPNSNSVSPTREEGDKILVTPDGDGNLKIDIRTPCNLPEPPMHLFKCLTDLQYKVINAAVNISDNRMSANIIVKIKRKNSAGQSAVCADLEKILASRLSN